MGKKARRVQEVAIEFAGENTRHQYVAGCLAGLRLALENAQEHPEDDQAEYLSGLIDLMEIEYPDVAVKEATEKEQNDAGD